MRGHDKTATPLTTVRTLYLHVTHACNLRCCYCYFSAGEKLPSELSLGEISVLFRDMVFLRPEKVVITGGEPLLRDDLLDIAVAFREILPQMDVRLAMVSNGMLISPVLAHQLAAVFDEVRISLDGPREVNDRLRGQGTFQGAMSAIRYLREAGLHPGVSVTASSFNLSSLSDFFSFLLHHEFVTDFHLAPLRPVGRASVRDDLVCSWRAAQSAAAEFWRRHFGVPSQLREASAYGLLRCGNCGVGRHINIHPDGAVYPCHVLSVRRFMLGNIREASIVDIVGQSVLLRELRDLDLRCRAGTSGRLRRLLSEAMCLGEVYREVPEAFDRLSSDTDAEAKPPDRTRLR